MTDKSEREDLEDLIAEAELRVAEYGREMRKLRAGRPDPDRFSRGAREAQTAIQYYENLLSLHTADLDRLRQELDDLDQDPDQPRRD